MLLVISYVLNEKSSIQLPIPSCQWWKHHLEHHWQMEELVLVEEVFKIKSFILLLAQKKSVNLLALDSLKTCQSNFVFSSSRKNVLFFNVLQNCQSFTEDSLWRTRRLSNLSAGSSYPSLNSNLSNSDSEKINKVE